MITTKAVRVHSFGGPDHLVLDDVPLQAPQEDEVLLRVHAASVNPLDYKLRSGVIPGIGDHDLPIMLGRDVAGLIETCGTDAHYMLRKGDPIFAMLGSDRGGYAEYVVVKAVEMVAVPQGLDLISAAAVPLAGLTAWQGLFDQGSLAQGQRVLIHGGAGGVGHFAVQFAKARGAYVYATASGVDLDFVRDLGADEAIDYRTQRFEDIVHEVDVVFDVVGGETQERSWTVLKTGGILVSTLSEPDRNRAAAEGKRGATYLVQPNAAQLSEIGQLIEAGSVKPHVDAVFPLAEASAAHERLEHGHVRGKIVLRVAD